VKAGLNLVSTKRASYFKSFKKTASINEGLINWMVLIQMATKRGTLGICEFANGLYFSIFV